MRKIAIALGRRRHGVIPGSIGLPIRQILLRVEEEQLVLVFIEMVRNVDRTAHIAADRVVAVPSARGAGPVAEEVVRIEIFIADVVVSKTMEIRRAALGDDIYHATCALSIFRLIV